MKRSAWLPLSIIFIAFLLLTTIAARANEGSEDFKVIEVNAPIAQVTNSTITPTVTNPVDNQALITPTVLISSTLTLEPFPTVTLVFPEYPDTATATSLSATQTPNKGIPLSMVSSNNPPAEKSGIGVVLILSWLILLIFAVLIARNASQIFSE